MIGCIKIDDLSRHHAMGTNGFGKFQDQISSNVAVPIGQWI